MILMFFPTFHSLGKTCSIFVAAGAISVAGCFCTQAADFRITSIRVTNNDIRLNWNAPGGSNYVVQVSTQLGSNFVNLGPTNFIPSGSDQLLSYTHPGARTGAASRFYRVRAFAPARLEIQPTNAMIAPNMTNRYKVLFVSSDNVTNDVTTNASLSVASLTPGVAQFFRITTNGFAAVRGVSVGLAPIRAVYQGVSNTVSLMVSNMNGGMYSDPSSFSGYAKGQSSTGKVFGIFGTNTVNITPATDLAVLSAGATRVDSYNVAADVANSFALVTGLSGADDSIVFIAGDSNTTASIHWCEFTNVTLVPASIQVLVGETQEVAVIVHSADGATINGLTRNPGFLFDTSLARTEQNGSTLRVVGLAEGFTLFQVDVTNPVNCDVLSVVAGLTVTIPRKPAITNQPSDQFAAVESNAKFAVTAGGSQPLAYQWQFNGTNVLGALTNSLNLTNVAYAQQGSYRVVVTNTYGSVTSSVATLTVAGVGVALWTNRYDGPANRYDGATAIALDGSGNVFVTGDAQDAGGNGIYATIAYSGLGAPIWTNRYNGPVNGCCDGAVAIAVGSNGVFVTGFASVIDGSVYATIKYSNSGIPQWTNRYNGPVLSGHAAKAIAVDTSGNVFVTGDETSGGASDYVTIAYSSAGTPLWTNRYNGPANGNDRAAAMAVDSNGNVFVTGYETGSTGDFDYATIAYSNAGAPLWTNRYNGPANGNDRATAIAVDSSGNIFVTGSATVSDGVIYATIKYSNSGTPFWTNRYTAGAGSFGGATAIAVNNNGDVFVTGFTALIGSFPDYATIKYSNMGMPAWTNRYNGPGNNIDRAKAIAVDKNDNVFVTGHSVGEGGAFEYATIKYSRTGEIRWIGRYNGSVSNGSFPVAMAVDSNGDVFVTGGTGASGDYATVKYSSGCTALNDAFQNRIFLSGSFVVTNANNECASKEPGEFNHAANIGGKSLWWSWMAPVNGTVTVSTCGSNFDTLLAVYTGSALNALTLVPGASNDDNGSACGVGSLQSQVQFNAVAGTTYQIAVDGYKYSSEPMSRSGNIVLTIHQ
jgi:hypothetical protein